MTEGSGIEWEYGFAFDGKKILIVENKQLNNQQNMA